MTGVELSPGAWLLVVGIGTLLALDGVSWPQSMASRPIVAATIGGALFGAPGAGFFAGAWLELAALRHPPYGAARYPETGPAALISGAAYGLSETGSLGALAASVLAGWAIGWIGTHTIAVLRAYNARLVGDPRSVAGNLDELERRHRAALRLDAARGALISGSLFIPVALGVRLVESWPGTAVAAPAVLLAATVSIASLSGAGARLIGGRRSGWPAFALGTLGGLTLLWLLG
jgi:mannose/fructose/N-acetylgalactosamine-specific phosphotransferase system component IIC